jgi:hypothetical protein
MIIKQKIQSLFNIIDQDADTDGDYWIHHGNDLLFEILNTFNEAEWKFLMDDLKNWQDSQLSIFIRAMKTYDSELIDPIWIFGYIFTILNDLDDCDCLVQDLYLLKWLEQKDVNLLFKVKGKIELIRLSYKRTIHSSEVFSSCESMIDGFIKN